MVFIIIIFFFEGLGAKRVCGGADGAVLVPQMVSSEPLLLPVSLEGEFSSSMKEMIGGCCVCSDERGWAENPLVYCDGHGCNVAVHQGECAGRLPPAPLLPQAPSPLPLGLVPPPSLLFPFLCPPLRPPGPSCHPRSPFGPLQGRVLPGLTQAVIPWPSSLPGFSPMGDVLRRDFLCYDY